MISFTLAAVLAMAMAAPGRAITPNCFFNVSMDDNSPLVRYDPSDQWTSLFVNSDLGSWQPGVMGWGASTHSAYGIGPSVNIEYPGTIAMAQGLLGNVSATPIRWEVDGNTQPAVKLFNVSFDATSNDIPVGAHTFKMSLDASSTHPNAIMMFRFFQSVCGVVAETNDPDQVSCETIEFAKDLGTKLVIFQTNNWKPFQSFGGVGGQPEIDYSSIVANNTPSLTIFPPTGANYFYLNGTVGNMYGHYTVEIDPAPPYPRQINTFNASNSWDVPGELFYYTPLDPAVTYSVKITGDDDPTKALGLHSFKYCLYKQDGSLPGGMNTTTNGGVTPDTSPVPVKKKTNVGAIAGGVAGGVVAAAVIAALIFFLCRRKRRRAAPEADPAMFTIDDTVDATTPYRGPSDGGVAKLAEVQQPYDGYPTYARNLYQEPNMMEVDYGTGAAPLLMPHGDTQSRQYSMQSGGPFTDSQQGSGRRPTSEGSYPIGSDGRPSISTGMGSTGAGMAMGAYHPGPGSGHDMSSGPTSGPTSEKSVPAHQRPFRVEHEQDAGGLPMPAEDVERLPPTYNPHWLDTRMAEGSSAGVPPGAGPSAMGGAQPPMQGSGNERGLPPLPGSSQPKPGVFHPPGEKR